MMQHQSDNQGTGEQPLKPRASRIWLRRGVEVLLFLVVIFGVRAWQQRDIVKGPAPVLQGVLLDGSAYQLAARPERPLLVHFWGTWCPICRAEQGSIQALHREKGNVITVAMQSGTSAAVKDFMQVQQTTFPVLNDMDGAISRSWGVNAVPASFILGTDGKIRYVEVGYTSELGLRLRLWLAGL